VLSWRNTRQLTTDWDLTPTPPEVLRAIDASRDIHPVQLLEHHRLCAGSINPIIHWRA